MPIDSSKFFDSIRIKPNKLSAKQQAQAREAACMCEWPDCKNKGPHRAPKGRDNAREYWHLCLNHVREYNQSYNFFDGMSDDAVARYQKDAVTGHRPTWKVGTGGRGRLTESGVFESYGTAQDPFGVFRELGGAPRPGAEPGKAEGRTVRNAERKAFHALGLEIDAVRADIKARFKELVKRHHPDVNGGDRGSEDKLREIIQAYNYLKSAGFC